MRCEEKLQHQNSSNSFLTEKLAKLASIISIERGKYCDLIKNLKIKVDPEI